MTDLDDVERTLRALAFGADGPRLADEGAFGAAPERLRLYRTLVTNTVHGAIRRACPHARRIGGEARFAAHVARFLAEQPLRVRFTRDLPGAFTAWLLEHPGAEVDAAAYAELCHFESLEIEVTMAEPTTSPPPGDLAMDASARLAIYQHPVHTVTARSTSLPAATTQPTVLVCFQRAEALAVASIAPAVGKVILACASGASMQDAIAGVIDEGRATGIAVDVGLVRSALVDLHRRGAIASLSLP
jgi:hypothetical protein